MPKTKKAIGPGMVARIHPMTIKTIPITAFHIRNRKKSGDSITATPMR